MKHFSALVIAAAISGCMPEQSETNGIGIANPASEYCVSIGGSVEIRDEADGQAGYCHLPDGRIVEEWELYRAREQ